MRNHRLLRTDLTAIAWAMLVFTVGLWAVRGGWDLLAHPSGQWWRIGASLSGMLATLCGVYGLLLTARLRWMERAAGLDRLFVWHRISGDTMGVLLVLHVITSVLAEQELRGGIKNAILDMTGREPYMALATVGTALVGIVIITSLRAVRQRLSYETWYFIHVTVYFGLALSLAHQLTLGSTLAGNLALQATWTTLVSLAFATALFGRWWKLIRSVARPLRVTSVHCETDNAVSITIGGKNARNLRGEAGQFVVLRLLRERQWWKANPFSLSAAPIGQSLRITVKERGDASSALAKVRIGDRIAVEGPFGVQTPSLFADRRPVFVAGGIGIAPVCALLQVLPAHSKPLVLLRARRVEDIALLGEITVLTERLGGTLHTLLGPTASLRGQDPFSAHSLRAVIGSTDDVAAHVCGPPSLLRSAASGLRAAGVNRNDIHMELPWW